MNRSPNRAVSRAPNSFEKLIVVLLLGATVSVAGCAKSNGPSQQRDPSKKNRNKADDPDKDDGKGKKQAKKIRQYLVNAKGFDAIRSNDESDPTAANHKMVPRGSSLIANVNESGFSNVIAAIPGARNFGLSPKFEVSKLSLELAASNALMHAESYGHKTVVFFVSGPVLENVPGMSPGQVANAIVMGAMNRRAYDPYKEIQIQFLLDDSPAASKAWRDEFLNQVAIVHSQDKFSKHVKPEVTLLSQFRLDATAAPAPVVPSSQPAIVVFTFMELDRVWEGALLEFANRTHLPTHKVQASLQEHRDFLNQWGADLGRSKVEVQKAFRHFMQVLTDIQGTLGAADLGLENLGGNNCFANAANKFLFAHDRILNLPIDNQPIGNLAFTLSADVKLDVLMAQAAFFDSFDAYLRLRNRDSSTAGNWFLKDRGGAKKYLRKNQIDSTEYLTELKKILNYKSHYASFIQASFFQFPIGGNYHLQRPTDLVGQNEADIELDLASKPASIQEAITRLGVEEELDEKNLMLNEVTGQYEKAKKTLLFVLNNGDPEPDHVVVMLKRFDSLDRKIFHKVEISPEIEIEYYHSTVADAQLVKGSPNYLPPQRVKLQLRAAVWHGGGTGGGHFTAFVRDLSTGSWTEHNDSRVIPNASAERLETDGYIFLYVKR